MNSPPTFQTFQLDCVLQILKYVPLPECISLRSTCKHLKTAVEEHFRTSVQSLPVLFTATNSSDEYAEFNRRFDEVKQQDVRNYFSYYQKITYGSTSGLPQKTIWENKYVFETRFQFENCLILFNPANLKQFVEFIEKYMPNITKLGLVFDRSIYLDNIPLILSRYRKQLKVLLLKKTPLSGVRIAPNFFYRHRLVSEKFELPEKVYCSVNSLDALEELYFFSRSFGHLSYGNSGSTGQQFVEGMCRKLRLFHILSLKLTEANFRFQSEVYENLRELGCSSHEMFNESTSIFPQLEKLILRSDETLNIDMLTPQSLPNLKNLVFCDLHLTEETLESLGSFPNLQQIYCRCLRLDDNEDNYYDDMEPNRKLKFLEIDEFFERDHPNLSGEIDPVTNFSHKIIADFKEILSLFPALKKIVIREPLRELTAADLKYLRELQIPRNI